MNAILRALAILMTTSVVTVLAGIVRQKVLAVGVGPTGVGQLGLLLSLTAAAATLGGLGLSTSGVQGVATTKDTDSAQAAQQGLVMSTWALAAVAGLGVLLLGPSIGLAALPEQVVTALAVAFTVAAAGQIALLNGLGHIRDIAWVNGLSAVASTAVTTALVFSVPVWGIYSALLTPPAFLFVLSMYFQRLRRRSGTPLSWPAVWRELQPILGLGMTFAAAQGISSLGQYAARWYIGREFGEVSLGHYQAAWAITMVYLGVLLSSMSVEFFPRVSRVVSQGDAAELGRVIANQIKLTLGLALPIICLFILFSPVIIRVLYSPEFDEAAGLARIQALGDVFKLGAWALSYTLLARNARLFIFLSELSWVVAYLLLLWLLPQWYGFEGIGWAYVGAYGIYFLVTFLAFAHHSRSRLPRATIGWVCGAAALASVHLFLFQWMAARVSLIALDVVLVAMAFFWWTRKSGRLKNAAS